MSDLTSWNWVAVDRARKLPPVRFSATTYIEARARAATMLRVPEMQLECRVVFEHQLKAKKEMEAA